jgi:hypothetical protein
MLKKKLLTDKSGQLYEDMVDRAAKNMADDIDFEIMTTILLEGGWTKVVLEPMTWERGAEIDLWVHKNIKGKSHDRGLVWLFEDSKDAMMFSLRWLG